MDSPLQISASATAVPDPGQGRSFAQAETNLIFQIQVNSPHGGVVPIKLQALLQSQGQSDPANQLGIFGQATGFAQLTIQDNKTEFQPDYYSFAGCAFQGCTYSVNDPIKQMIDLQANTPYEVQETVFVLAAVLDTGVALSSSASADPQFSIPESYLSTHPGVSLQISDGFQGLVSSAPEPATWAMLILGVAMIGCAARRRSNGVAVAA